MLPVDLGQAIEKLARATGASSVVVDVVVNGRIETHEIKTVSIVETVALDGSVVTKHIRVNASRV